MSKVLFLHGSSVSPQRTRRGGRLQEAGHEVELCPALPYPDDLTTLWRALWTEDNRPWFDQAVQIAQDAYDRCRPDVVVGSSMGGQIVLTRPVASDPRVAALLNERRLVPSVAEVEIEGLAETFVHVLEPPRGS